MNPTSKSSQKPFHFVIYVPSQETFIAWLFDHNEYFFNERSIDWEFSEIDSCRFCTENRRINAGLIKRRIWLIS